MGATPPRPRPVVVFCGQGKSQRRISPDIEDKIKLNVRKHTIGQRVISSIKSGHDFPFYALTLEEGFYAADVMQRHVEWIFKEVKKS